MTHKTSTNKKTTTARRASPRSVQRLVSALLDVIAAGGPCANVCYNVGQGQAVDDHKLIFACAKRWDAAVQAAVPLLKRTNVQDSRQEGAR